MLYAVHCVQCVLCIVQYLCTSHLPVNNDQSNSA